MKTKQQMVPAQPDDQDDQCRVKHHFQLLLHGFFRLISLQYSIAETRRAWHSCRKPTTVLQHDHCLVYHSACIMSFKCWRRHVIPVLFWNAGNTLNALGSISRDPWMQTMAILRLCGSVEIHPFQCDDNWKNPCWDAEVLFCFSAHAM